MSGIVDDAEFARLIVVAVASVNHSVAIALFKAEFTVRSVIESFLLLIFLSGQLIAITNFWFLMIKMSQNTVFFKIKMSPNESIFCFLKIKKSQFLPKIFY